MNEYRYTALAQWLKCPQQFHYSNIEKLEPKRLSQKMALGSLYHKAMELYWKGVLGEEKEISQNLADYLGELVFNKSFSPDSDEHHAICGRLLHSALSMQEESVSAFNCERYYPIMIEEKIELEIDGIKLVGHVDAVLKDLVTGQLWVVDYKTRERFKSEEDELLNLQFAIYQHILAISGVQVAGVQVWQVSNKDRESPTLLKNGAMSQKNINCTWESYKQALALNGLDEADYKGMKKKLEANTRMLPLTIYKDNMVLASIMAEVIRALKTLDKNRNITYRNLTPGNCSYCEFKKICEADLQGFGAGEVKKQQFVQKIL